MVSSNIPDDSAEWLTREEAARLLGLTAQTVGYHIQLGHIVARKHGPQWLIHISAVRAFKRRKAGRPRKAHPGKDDPGKDDAGAE